MLGPRCVHRAACMGARCGRPGTGPKPHCLIRLRTRVCLFGAVAGPDFQERRPIPALGCSKSSNPKFKTRALGLGAWPKESWPIRELYRCSGGRGEEHEGSAYQNCSQSCAEPEQTSLAGAWPKGGVAE